MIKYKKIFSESFKNLNAIMDYFETKYPGLSTWISENKIAENIQVSKIEVPKKFRNKGIGTEFMNAVIEYANRMNKPITLTPSSDFGGSVSKLKTWYSKLGFERNKDHRYSDSLIKYPDVI